VPVAVDRAVHQLLRRGGLGDVAGDAEEALAGAELRGRLVESPLGAGVAGDVPSQGQQGLGDAEADAAGSAGDDGGLALCTHDRFPFVPVAATGGAMEGI
jgi:hypothetical protein